MNSFTSDPYQCYKSELLKDIREFGAKHLSDDAFELADMLFCDEIGIDTAEQRLAQLEEIETEADRREEIEL